jgi:hypothetical protein
MYGRSLSTSAGPQGSIAERRSLDAISESDQMTLRAIPFWFIASLGVAYFIMSSLDPAVSLGDLVGVATLIFLGIWLALFLFTWAGRS